MNSGSKNSNYQINQIDFADLFYRILRYKWLMLGGMAIGIAASLLSVIFFKKIFPVKASIKIENSSNIIDPSEAIFGTGIFKNQDVITDQTLILKSYPVVYKTLDELNFEITYFKKNWIFYEEVYSSREISILIDTASLKQPIGIPLEIKFIDSKSFKIQISGKSEIDKSEINYSGNHEVDEWIDVNGFKFKIISNTKQKPESDYRIIVQDLKRLTLNYQQKLLVEQEKEDASIIRMYIETPFIQKELKFFNTLIDNYFKNNLDEKNRFYLNSRNFLVSQIQKLNDTLSQLELQVAQFRSEKNIYDIAEKNRFLTSELIKIEQQQQEIQLKNEYAQYIENYFKNEANYDKIISPSLFGIQDELLDNLIKEIVQNQSARNQLLKTGKENNPLLKSLDLKIESNRKAIFDNIAGYKKSAEFGSKFNELSQAKINAKLSDLPDDEKTLFNLKRKLQINENIFLLLNQKKLEADVMISSNVPDFSIVDSPRLLSVDPIFPSKLFLFSLPLAGFLISFLIASFLVATNTKIATKQDLLKIKNAVFAGYVGNQDDLSLSFMQRNQLSGVAESFRLIKSNLSFMSNTETGCPILLTSSFQSGEGKSYVTSNLATLYASSGARTLFIGGDLRKSRVPEEFNVTNNKGLSTLLINQHQLSEVIYQSSIPNLFVIPPGPLPPNPSQLFGNTKLSDYFLTLKSNFDIIIIDTAPLSLISDTVNLLKFADITLLIIRQNYTPYNAIEFYNELIDSGKIHNCAVVFNDVKKDSTFYYRYGYQKGYYHNS